MYIQMCVQYVCMYVRKSSRSTVVHTQGWKKCTKMATGYFNAVELIKLSAIINLDILE